MPRASGVPYHQNVYDLLDLPPGRCPEAEAMIAAHEPENGPLPASVREWLTVPNVLPLKNTKPFSELGTHWYEYSKRETVYSIEAVLMNFSFGFTPSGRYAAILGRQSPCGKWLVDTKGSDDPPVWAGGDGRESAVSSMVADTFSEFVWGWFARFHAQGFTPLSLNSKSLLRAPDVRPKPHATGKWACTPRAPYPFPVLDDLTERFGNSEAVIVADGTTRHTFRTPDGTIRVTADDPGHPELLAAWWVYSQTADGFERMAAMLKPWGVLGDSPRTVPIGEPNPLWTYLNR